MWIGIILGVIIAGKVDAKTHSVGLLISLIYILLFGISNINYFLLIFFIIASFTDEKIDLMLKRIKTKNILYKILDLRLVVELSALVISIITNVWILFLSILIFDIGYKLSELIYYKNTR